MNFPGLSAHALQASPTADLPQDTLLPARGRLFVVSGPSGVGKDAVLEMLLSGDESEQMLRRCITATTRLPRPQEEQGVDYFFFTREEFEARITESFFLEHAQFAEDYYGTPAHYPDEERSQGRDVLLKIEVQGALQVKERVPEAILIFIAPPSWKELERRLRARRTDTEEKIQKRLATARRELDAAARYDYLIVNDTLEHAVDALRAILSAERSRIVPPESMRE